MLRVRTSKWWPIITALCIMPVQVDAAADYGIIILKGQFGTLGSKRKLDIAAPLQRLCGTGSERCDVFCSETSFGLFRLGRKAICRVTYRCFDGSVKSSEAAREEPIMLRCGDETADAASPDAMTPPPYSPPPGQ